MRPEPGLYYYTADNETYSAKAGDLKAGAKYNNTYVEIDNSSYGCDKTFWFGIPATSCEGKTVVVTVTDENDKVYSKVIDSESSTGKYLTFEQGKVSAFTVNVTAASEEKQYITIKDLREKGVGQITENLCVKGYVISDADAKNIHEKSLYISDGTAGIAVRFTEAHNFKTIGQEVEISLLNISLAKFGGLLQISNLPLDNAVATSNSNVLEPVAISVSDLLTGNYESMYVAISNVQVVNDDLSKKLNNTTVKMEDKDGNNFNMYFREEYIKASETVPQGSGTIKGIASIYNSVQLLPRNESDYAGLTGARFGEAPIFEFGTPVFSATTMKQGAAIEGGKITIPYSNATGEESYTISVSVSGEAADGIIDVVNLIRSIQVSGSGNLEIPIKGTPQYAGSVKFTISGIDGLATTEVTATVASATETSKKITVDELGIPAQGDEIWKTSAFSKTVGGFSISIEAKSAGNKPSYKADNHNVRLYPKTSLTIESAKAITKIVFNAKINANKNGKVPTVKIVDAEGKELGTFSDYTWTGSANKVIVAVGGEAGNVDVTDFTIYY